MPTPRSVRITGDEYSAFDRAYQWFNDKLFGNRLPPCLITLQRKARSRGYFANDRFGHRVNATAFTDELALNPDTFADRSDKDILSTLVERIVNSWQLISAGFVGETAVVIWACRRRVGQSTCKGLTIRSTSARDVPLLAAAFWQAAPARISQPRVGGADDRSRPDAL